MKLLTNPSGDPVLEQFSEEGFVDCVFRITNFEPSESHFTFHLSASSEGSIVGFNVALLKEIKAGLDEESNLIQEHVYFEGVVFQRSGPESDRLIDQLAKLYGLNRKGRQMRSREAYTAIALHQGNIDLSHQPIKLKLFGREEEGDDLYNESFFNVDLPNGIVFWNEKDQEYREALIRALSR